MKQVDPAEKLLDLKVCDPAMGSGHFLVNLVDHLADRVITAMADAEATVDDYISPLTERIDTIRNTIIDNAEKRGWTINPEQLDDRHIVRRMVLKRCVYGVDKNPMAVELAKVALWLHTFTVGAPLSFLDHHLRCGDSLFGSWVRASIDRAAEHGGLFLEGPVKRAMRAAAPMQILEGLTDAEIAEAHRSADVFTEIEEMTAPLNAFLAMVHAFDWLNIRDRDDKAASWRLLYRHLRRSHRHCIEQGRGFNGNRGPRAVCRAARRGTATARRRTLLQLAGGFSRRVVRVGERRIARRIRCCDWKSPLGPDEAAAG